MTDGEIDARLKKQKPLVDHGRRSLMRDNCARLKKQKLDARENKT